LERWENVAEAFQLNDQKKVKNSHVLLVDDVLTTGATLEACGHALLDTGDAELSICSLAYANNR
jgi:predicted amidophosphoribosyltransferase